MREDTRLLINGIYSVLHEYKNAIGVWAWITGIFGLLINGPVTMLISIVCFVTYFMVNAHEENKEDEAMRSRIDA